MKSNDTWQHIQIKNCEQLVDELKRVCDENGWKIHHAAKVALQAFLKKHQLQQK